MLFKQDAGPYTNECVQVQWVLVFSFFPVAKKQLTEKTVEKRVVVVQTFCRFHWQMIFNLKIFLTVLVASFLFKAWVFLNTLMVIFCWLSVVIFKNCKDFFYWQRIFINIWNAFFFNKETINEWHPTMHFHVKLLTAYRYLITL